MPAPRAEDARGLMLELFSEGFEESERPGGVELAAYTDAVGERRIRTAFGGARVAEVDGDWAERWKDFHDAVRIGPLWVGPPWQAAPDDALAVVIDPGTAFGTGAHPTTRLCLELLVTAPRGSLLDVGCGSGVLSIAAARLGFGPIDAVDQDEAAVEATRQNARANSASVRVRLADAVTDPLPAADVAVANIALGVVEALAPRLASRPLITSGYLASERPGLTGFRAVERRESEGWAADRFERLT